MGMLQGIACIDGRKFEFDTGPIGLNEVDEGKISNLVSYYIPEQYYSGRAMSPEVVGAA